MRLLFTCQWSQASVCPIILVSSADGLIVIAFLGGSEDCRLVLQTLVSLEIPWLLNASAVNQVGSARITSSWPSRHIRIRSTSVSVLPLFAKPKAWLARVHMQEWWGAGRVLSTAWMLALGVAGQYQLGSLCFSKQQAAFSSILCSRPLTTAYYQLPISKRVAYLIGLWLNILHHVIIMWR